MPLKVENLSKRSGREWLFRDVSFEIGRGTIFGILGNHDSGSFSLLEAIAEGSSNGNIQLTVRDGSSLPRTAAFTDGSARENLLKRLFPSSENLLVDKKREFLEEAIREPADLTVINEPFVGFDITNRYGLAERLRNSVIESGNILLFGTADFSDLILLSDHAGIMESGYLIQTGTPQELYDEPETRTASRLTGLANIIEARRLTSSKSDMPEFQTIEGGHRLYTQKAELRSLGAINKNTFLSIRPEQISISFGASFPEDNLIKAVIGAVRSMGAFTILDLDCDGLTLQASVPRLVGIGIGEECMVGLPPDRIKILKD